MRLKWAVVGVGALAAVAVLWIVLVDLAADIEIPDLDEIDAVLADD